MTAPLLIHREVAVSGQLLNQRGAWRRNVIGLQ